MFLCSFFKAVIIVNKRKIERKLEGNTNELRFGSISTNLKLLNGCMTCLEKSLQFHHP